MSSAVPLPRVPRKVYVLSADGREVLVEGYDVAGMDLSPPRSPPSSPPPLSPREDNDNGDERPPPGLEGAAPPDLVARADASIRSSVRKASAVRPIYIYAATLIFLVAWVWGSALVESVAFPPTHNYYSFLNTPTRVGNNVYSGLSRLLDDCVHNGVFPGGYVFSSSLNAIPRAVIRSFMVATEEFMNLFGRDPSRRTPYCDCSSVDNQAPWSVAAWDQISQVAGNKGVPNRRVREVARADVSDSVYLRTAHSLIALHNPSLHGPLLCHYETVMPDTVPALPPYHICVLGRGSNRYSIMLNLDIKGYTEEAVVVREANAMCARKIMIRKRRRLIYVRYLTLSNLTVNLRVDDIQEAVHIQQHWEAMRGEYNCTGKDGE